MRQKHGTQKLPAEKVMKDIRRRTQTRIAGLTADARIAPWGIKGAMDGPAVATLVREVRVPETVPRTVVVLDNLDTHRNVESARALRERGSRFLYLVPCSPDLSPN